MLRKLYGTSFYGNEASEYAKENNRLDYATLAKSFDAVLNNGIIQATSDIGYWGIENGSEEYYEDNNGNIYTYDEKEERIEEIEAQIEALEDEETEEAETEIEELKEEIEALNEAHYEDIYQYFIISDNGAEILKNWTDEIVMYNEELDMYVWCVTHYGTSWDYVLTDIELNCGEEAYN
jgi:DNA repair exonuclease SbcCD ATPase subunit